jgi:Glycosyl transferase family 2
MVVTKNGGAGLYACLESIRASGFTDDIVVRVHPQSTDNSLAIARHFATNASLLDPDNGAFRCVAELCKGDYVLRLDDDEVLRGDWDRCRFQRLLAYNDVTHFWIPRRWAVPNERFIAERPWYPNLQMRLFRNDPGLLTWAAEADDPGKVRGASMMWPDGWIEKRSLVLTTREQREEKCRLHHCNEMYLYEDRKLATLPLDANPEIEQPEWTSPEVYELGTEIDFSDVSRSDNFALTGWGHSERWGRWTVGPLAKLDLPLDRPLGARAMFKAVVIPYVHPNHRPLNVEIYFGQQLVKTLSFHTGGRKTISVAIPAPLCANETRARIGIRILNPRSPLSLGESNDARQRGLGFLWAWLK